MDCLYQGPALAGLWDVRIPATTQTLKGDPLLNRKLTTKLAILAAAAGLPAFAATADASTLDTDRVELSSDQPDFTGEAAFNFSNGMMTPEVTGTLSVEDGGNTCVRVRARPAPLPLGSGCLPRQRGSDPECPSTNAHRDYTLEIDPF